MYTKKYGTINSVFLKTQLSSILIKIKCYSYIKTGFTSFSRMEMILAALTMIMGILEVKCIDMFFLMILAALAMVYAGVLEI